MELPIHTECLCSGGCDDLDLHHAGFQGSDLFLHPVCDAGVHGGPARQHSVGIEVLADVNVTLHDGIEGSFVPQPSSASQTRMGIELGVWITGTTEHVCHMAISAFLTDNFGRICTGLPNIGLGSLKIKKKM